MSGKLPGLGSIPSPDAPQPGERPLAERSAASLRGDLLRYRGLNLDARGEAYVAKVRAELARRGEPEESPRRRRG